MANNWEQTLGYRRSVVPDTDTTYSGIQAIYTGSGGDLTLLLGNDNEPVTFAAVPTGQLLPLAVSRVMPETTASGILLLSY